MALTLKFNLAEVLRQGFTVEQRKVLTPSINRLGIQTQFARRAIDRILERTNSGIDKRGNGFVPYSKAYRESTAFQIFGKSSRVNLKLSGEMHASIGVFGSQGGLVTIAITDPEQEAKARGHIRGARQLPVRDFWGLPMNDQVEILREIFRVENAAERFDQVQEALEAIGVDEVTVLATEIEETGDDGDQ